MIRKLLFLIVAVAVSLPCSSQRKLPAGDISVMSYNVRNGNMDDGPNSWDLRKKASISMIQRYKPDLFGIQEGQPKQVSYLKSNLPEYTEVGVGRDDGKNKGERMSIFFRDNRFNLLESGTFWLSETPDTVSKGWDSNHHRTVTWVKFSDRKSKKTIYYFNTHLDHKGLLARENGVKLLISKVKEIAGADAICFITGDFNLKSTNPRIKPMFDNFLSVRNTAPVTDSQATFNAWGKRPTGTIIDYVFYRNGVIPLAYRTITDDFGVPYISDHYPIIGVFKFKK